MSSKSKKVEEIKVIVMGGGGVGKSTLTIQFIEGYFIEDYDPTIEDSYRKEVTIDGKTYSELILDTAGSDIDSSYYDYFFKSANAFILVYDITRRISFEEVEYLESLVCKTRQCDTRFVLCGNKCDHHARQVKKEEGESLAESKGWKFFETSAKTGENVELLFHTALREGLTSSNDNCDEQRKGMCIIC